MSHLEALVAEIAQAVAAIVLAELRRNPLPQPRLVDVKGAGVIMSRSDKAVRHLVRSGQLRNASPDGRLQIDVLEIYQLIERNKRN